MPGKFAFVLALFPVLLSFYGGKPVAEPAEIERLYQKANSLFNASGKRESKQKSALDLFNQIIGKLEQSANRQSLDQVLFDSYFKKGILLDIQARYAEAAATYCQAICLQKTHPTISDSSVFAVKMYAGACYYNLNRFDSASLLLLQSQTILDRLPNLPDKETLYNSLGVLYYDNGNYIQSRNYFSQALDIIGTKQPMDHLAATSIQTNIATSLYRLGRYEEALSIYQKIQKTPALANYVFMNMGRAQIAINHYRDAMECFRKVNGSAIHGVYNEMANAEYKLGREDSALFFLNKLLRIPPDNLNPLDIGINKLFRADLLNSKGQFDLTLDELQNAIGIFSGHFKNPDYHANPIVFTGTFAYYWLFEALSKKAATLDSAFRRDRKEDLLLAEASTYKSLIALLSYIEKSYDTDDAKIFLKKRSWNIYQEAINVSLELNQRHPLENYLEEAFQISEKNKASIVIANLKERGIDGVEGNGSEVIRNIKYNIARLNVQYNQTQDLRVQQAISKEKSHYEIELAEIQKRLEQNNEYCRLKYSDAYPSVKELQVHLQQNQALISFHLSTGSLKAFIITQSGFSLLNIDSLENFQVHADEWINQLKASENGKKWVIGESGAYLYNHLIKPVQSLIPDKNEWMIIPDGILYFLPFESLPWGQSRDYVLQKIAISYQFSARLLIEQSEKGENSNSDNQVLAFAPFTKAGATFQKAGIGSMEALTASAEEIDGTNGAHFTDNQATKDAFLEEVSHYPIVHLATHAVSDLNNSAGSFVAFYPKHESFTDDCLFLEELYGLNMGNIRLMMISACETGKGELLHNEGVMSIARAFTYAGCKSVVNSLWKADDHATAFILKHFNKYLSEGLSKSKALQKAKLDYLNSDAIYKSPDYWSHLILVGNPAPLYKTKKPLYQIIGFTAFCFTLIYGWMLINRKKSRRFSGIKDFRIGNVV
ncbi:MAG: CHAT domain-containing protein [Chitinophagales bacterium]